MEFIVRLEVTDNESKLLGVREIDAVELGESVSDSVTETDELQLALAVTVCEGDKLPVLLMVESWDGLCDWLLVAVFDGEELPVPDCVGCCDSDCVRLIDRV